MIVEFIASLVGVVLYIGLVTLIGCVVAWQFNEILLLLKSRKLKRRKRREMFISFNKGVSRHFDKTIQIAMNDRKK